MVWLVDCDVDRLEGIGVAEVSLDGFVRRCNESFATIFDSAPHLMINKHVLSLTAESDRNDTVQTFSKIQSGEIKKIRSSKSYVTRTGLVKHCRLFSMAIEDQRTQKATHLLTYVYEIETAPDPEKERMMEMVLEVMGRMQSAGKVQIMAGNNTQADNNSTASNSSGNTQGVSGTVIVSIAILGAATILGVTALLASGQLRFGTGETSVEVNQPADGR